MPLADSHAHVSDPRFDADRPEVIVRARGAGVALIVDVGTDLTSSIRAVALARSEAGIRATVGVHPHHVASMTDDAWEKIELLAADPAVAAVGETGLDFYRDLSPRQSQRDAFERHLALAERLSKPVVVHSRDAGDAALGIMAGYRGRVAGVMHCFSGDVALMARVLDLGYLVSLAGNVSYPGAHELRLVARTVPEGSLLIETDCPYLAPVPLRGKRNEPANVALVARVVADARGVEVERLSEITYRNAEGLFGHS